MQENTRENPPDIQHSESRRVIIFPARLPPLSSRIGGEKAGLTTFTAGEKVRRISFIFSVRQVEHIIKEIMTIQTVPFSAPYIEGITEWSGHVAPVISLEGYLGFEIPDSEPALQDSRLIMIRIPGIGDEEGEERVIIRTTSVIRMVSLPIIPCTPVPSIRASGLGILNSERVRGIYEWDEGYLVAPRFVIGN